MARELSAQKLPLKMERVQFLDRLLRTSEALARSLPAREDEAALQELLDALAIARVNVLRM